MKKLFKSLKHRRNCLNGIIKGADKAVKRYANSVVEELNKEFLGLPFIVANTYVNIDSDRIVSVVDLRMEVADTVVMTTRISRYEDDENSTKIENKFIHSAFADSYIRRHYAHRILGRVARVG